VSYRNDATFFWWHDIVMPFKVSKYPQPPDPRPTYFQTAGMDNGAVPPYQYLLSTVGATGILSPLNDGILLTASSLTNTVNGYEPAALPAGWSFCQLVIEGSDVVIPSPADHTVTRTLTIFFQGVATLLSESQELYPPPIAVSYLPAPTLILSPPGDTCPNAIALTPRRWDATE
jgi:hypothetical protein